MIEQGIKDVAKEAKYLGSVAVQRYPKSFFSLDFSERHEEFVKRVKENLHEQKELLVHLKLSSTREIKERHKLLSEMKELYCFDIVEEEFRAMRKIMNIAEQSVDKGSRVLEIVEKYNDRINDFHRVFESFKEVLVRLEKAKNHNEIMKDVHKIGHELHILERYEKDKKFLVEDLSELDKMPLIITNAMKKRRKSFLEQTGNVYEKSVKFLKLILPERKMSLGLSMVVEYLVKVS